MQSKFKYYLFTPILIIVIFVILFVANIIPQETLRLNENPYLSVVVIQLLTYAIPALFYTRIRGKELKPGLRMKLFRPSQILFMLQALIFIISGTVLFSMVMFKIAPDAFEASSMTVRASFAMNSRFFDGIYLVVAFALLPALTEEFVFRGIVIGEYQNAGTGLAAVMSAVMFAMMHFSLVRFPVYFFSGLVLACVVYATRSLLAGIIVHTANNVFVLFCEKYVLNVVEKGNISLTLFIIIVGAVALLSLMLMLFEANNIYHTYAQKNIQIDYLPVRRKGRLSRIAHAFLSPTFLILLILFIVSCLV